MSDVRTNPTAKWCLWVLAAIVLLTASQPVAAQEMTPYGKLEHDVTSEFSHIRIRRRDDYRSMMFVRDTQEEVVESMLDLAHPNRLVVPYTQFMFLSYSFRPEQERVLIVGLGGGSMVHFLKKFDPELKVDVVEIDPAVVDIARRFFGREREDHHRRRLQVPRRRDAEVRCHLHGRISQALGRDRLDR